MRLPEDIDAAGFDALHDDAASWLEPIAELAALHSASPVVQALDGTALVALVGRELVVKLYPPFLADHFAFEHAALTALAGKLSVPTPVLIDSGARGDWPYLVMTQLRGTPLSSVWPSLEEDTRCDLLFAIGALAAEVHALPSAPLAEHAPPWDGFIERQRAGCLARQRRTGLPPRLLAELESYLEGDLPSGPAVILTGEYTPMNLFVDEGRLAAMYDFGDGLVGPAHYDWLGPLCFLAAGRRARREAFLGGYGGEFDDETRGQLMRMLLLHRYSNLRAQIALDDWQVMPTLEALAARVFA